jgi:hypothetical protein
MATLSIRMSDAGDNVEVKVDAEDAEEVAEVSEAPKGKLSVEEALEVNSATFDPIHVSQSRGHD